ncbi:MAG: hypothetical protein ABIH63_01240 [archaeon]
MNDTLKALRSEYIKDFIQREGTFYSQSRIVFLNAVRRYVTWSFLSDTVMGTSLVFDELAHQLGLEKKVFDFYAKRNGNGNDHNGNGNGKDRILKMLEEKKNKVL